MQKLTKKIAPRPCPICSEEGTRQAVEVLPNGGLLYMIGHTNGRICKWAEYSSINNLARPEKSKSPTYIKCPKCGDLGRLNWAHDLHAKKEEQPFTFSYIIVHEKTEGKWGSGKSKMDKRRRCQSFTQDQRIAILKQIGRYIADPPRSIRKIITRKQKKPQIKQDIEKRPAISKDLVLLTMSQSKNKSDRNSLDKFIADLPRIETTAINPIEKQNRKHSRSNPNANLTCCVCNRLGTLRPRLSEGQLRYCFAHKINGKEFRHYISLLNHKHMSYCKSIDRKPQRKAL
jgi:hypothetical protein